MNYRRALRASTDTGLVVFAVMIIGVVLWTTDEVLNWNILPDWIDRYAQVLVIVLSILGGFAVVISLMCSFAVMAESAAERAGIVSPRPSPRARIWIIGGVVVSLVVFFGLHKLDQYRARQMRLAEEERQAARYAEAQAQLQDRMTNILALFSPGIQRHLVENGTEDGDKALARLLNAVHASNPFSPDVRVLVRAETPYSYCILAAFPESRQEQPGTDSRYVRRDFLTDLPTQWERNAIEEMFRGERVTMAKDRRGVFIDGETPGAWGSVTENGNVVAVVMLKAKL